MTKQKKWKYWLKLFGIAAACAVGFFGLIVAYVAITGGFKEKFIEIEGLTFDINSPHYYGDNSKGDPVFVITEDGEFKIAPLPEDATELDATIKITSGESLVEDILVLSENEEGELEFISAEKVENKENTYNIKINENFKIKLKENHESTLDRVIALYVEHLTDYCEANIIVDVPVESFKLKYEKINPVEGSEDTFFPGDSLYVYVDVNELLPSTSLLQSSLTDLTNKYKYMTFEINNEASDIARIERIVIDADGTRKALINILESGEFSVTASLCKTYIDEEKILTEDEIELLTVEEKEAYQYMLYGKEADLENEEEEIIGILAVDTITMKSEPITISSISATSEVLTYELFSNHILTATDLGIKINPENIAGSCYTSDDLAYLINDIEIKGGYFVSNEDYADTKVAYTQNGQTLYKYIKLSDRYLKVIKQVDADNNPIWSVTITDFYSNIEPSNCLYIEYSYTKDLEDGKKETYTFNNYVPLTIIKNDVPEFKIAINGIDGQTTDIIVGEDATSNVSSLSLNNANLLLINSDGSIKEPQTSFQNSNSPYKKVLYVTEDSSGNLTFANDLITVTNACLSTEEFPLTDAVIPNTQGNTGTTYVYAVVVKTDINGQIVDSNNEPITILANLNNCVVLYKTQTQNSIRINAYRPLEISTTETLKVYDNEFNQITDYENNKYFDFIVSTESIWDEQSQTNIEVNKVLGITMYVNTSVYIKLNYNNADSFKNAYDNQKFSYKLHSDIASVGSLTLHDGDYYIELTANKYDLINSTDSLEFRLNDSIIYNLSVTTRDYILQAITLSSNAQNSTDAVVKLRFDETLSKGFCWSVDELKNEELVIESKIEPLQAIVGSIEYKIYDYNEFMALYNSQNDISKWTEMPNETNDIIEYNGNPEFDEENQVETLKFNVKTAGKVVILAYYELDAQTTIYSNIIIIETKFPTGLSLLNNNFQYGYNEEIYNNEKVEVVYSSYNNQKTNLLTHVGTEGEGEKIVIQYEESENNLKPINNKLYKFEIIESDIEGITVQYDDSTQTHYLISPIITTNTYVKVKVSTTFGFDTNKTYNYKLVPDMLASINTNYQNLGAYYNNVSNELEMTKNDTVELFKFKVVNNEISSIGLLNITNNYDKTNYRTGIQDRITGSEQGDKTTIIYLPSSMTASDVNETLIEGFVASNLSIENGHVIYRTLTNIYEFKFVLDCAITDNNTTTITKNILITNTANDADDAYADISYYIYHTENELVQNILSFGVRTLPLI